MESGTKFLVKNKSMHIRNVYDKINPCDKKFTEKSSLKSHTNTVHDKIKPVSNEKTDIKNLLAKGI